MGNKGRKEIESILGRLVDGYFDGRNIFNICYNKRTWIQKYDDQSPLPELITGKGKHCKAIEKIKF